jgi:hypothetical protein
MPVPHVFKDAHPLGGVVAEAEQGDHIATIAALRCLLDDDRRPADLPQPQGQRQPGDTGADDDSSSGRRILDTLFIIGRHAPTIMRKPSGEQRQPPRGVHYRTRGGYLSRRSA